MSHHATLLDGLAQLLARNDMGIYNADGEFAIDERGITIAAFPDSPREVVALTLYSPEFTSTSPTATRRLSAASVQIKYRLGRDPLEGIAYLDGLTSIIHRKRIDLGPFTASGRFLSFQQLGMNNAHAWTFTSNWRFESLQAL